MVVHRKLRESDALTGADLAVDSESQYAISIIYHQGKHDINTHPLMPIALLRAYAQLEFDGNTIWKAKSFDSGPSPVRAVTRATTATCHGSFHKTLQSTEVEYIDF